MFAGQVRRPSVEQEELLRMLPHGLGRCRDTVRERGAGNVVELNPASVPPESERERRESESEDARSHDMEVDEEPQNGNGGEQTMPESTDVPSVELETVVEEEGMDVTGGENQEDVGNPQNGHDAERVSDVEMRRETSALSEPEPAPMAELENAEPSSAAHSRVDPGAGSEMPQDGPYGPVVRDTALARAMRRNLNMLDMGSSKYACQRQSGMEELCAEEVRIMEEAYMNENQKKKKKEIMEHRVPQTQLPNLVAAKKRNS